VKTETQIINGVEYVYEDQPYWDPVKKRGSHKRNYIGKNVNGVFVPNKKYLLRQELESIKNKTKPGPIPNEVCMRTFYGATYLLDEIGRKTGLEQDLKACFPNDYKAILSLAYYLVLESQNPMYRFGRWSRTHKHPFGKNIPSQRSSELFGRISEADKMTFFQRQSKRRLEKEYLAYDTTSISSYSQSLKQVRYGKNKEQDLLPQINLALLFGEKSGLPVYYRKLAGNIPDVKTLQNLIKDLEFLEIEKLNLVMDRGFYSEPDINLLYKHHHKFLIAGKTSLKFIRQKLDEIRANFSSRKNYNSKTNQYIQSFLMDWDYTETKPRSGKVIKEKRRIYVHYYFNAQHAADDKARLNVLLDQLEYELLEGRRKPENEKLYHKYYIITSTPVRGTKIKPRQDTIHTAEKNCGFFVLLSNVIKDPVETLEVYRAKDLVEKAFGNLKERLNMRRESVASEENLEGKLFVQFVALIYLSYIKKAMDDAGLFKNYTMQELLDELDIIERFQQPGKSPHLGEITEKQMKLYEAMDIEVPS
jgi:transposase